MQKQKQIKTTLFAMSHKLQGTAASNMWMTTPLWIPCNHFLNKVSVLAFPKEAVNKWINMLFSGVVVFFFLDNSVVV